MVVLKVPAKTSVVCKTGSACPFITARKIHAAYLKSLTDLNSPLIEKRREEIAMAEFVRDVTQHAAKADSDVWESLSIADRSGPADHFGHTFLRFRIKELKEDIERVKGKIEKRAEELIDFIKDPKHGLQQHLLDFHRHPIFESFDLYTDPEPLAISEFLQWRHMDHCLAVLTDQLAESGTGRTFLEELLTRDASAQGVAFKDAWGAFKKANSVRGPLGKLVYNLSPIISLGVSKAIRKHKLMTVASVLDDPDVRESLSKLADKINVPEASLRTAVADRADAFGSRVGSEDVNDLKKIVGEFDDFAQLDFDLKTGAAQTLDDTWWSLTLNLVSFAVSNGPILKKLKEAKSKDLLSLAQGMTDLAGFVAKRVEAKQILKGVDATSAARFAQVAGVAVNVAGLVLTLMEMDAALKSADAKKILVAYAGALVGVGGMVATLVSASVASGVFAVVGVAIAVVGGILLAENPIAGYLRRTPWGTESGEAGAIHMDHVIDEYYKTAFTLKIKMEVHYTENEPMIVIESNALSRHVPVTVKIEREDDQASVLRRVVPGEDKVAGKGEVHRPSLSWNDFFPLKGRRRVEVHRPWEVWEIIRRDDDTEHTLEAKMDIDRNGTFELKDKETGVEFPEA